MKKWFICMLVFLFLIALCSCDTQQTTTHGTPQVTVSDTPQTITHGTPQVTVNDTPQTTTHGTPQVTVNDTPQSTTHDTQSLPVSDTQQPQDNDWPEPVTNLEFWIAENVDNVDFSKYQEKWGLFGGREFYGTGYVPTEDEDGWQTDPEHCVIYTVTSYPDYSDRERHVTGIYITDPNVEFCGISLNSSFEEFESCMKEQGFEISKFQQNCLIARKGKYSVSFEKDLIRIMVSVENKNGIIF